MPGKHDACRVCQVNFDFRRDFEPEAKMERRLYIFTCTFETHCEIAIQMSLFVLN